MLDKNGMPVTEEVEIKIPAFRVVPVFDVSQTEGKELPDIEVNELSGSVEDYEDFMQALTEVSPVPIGYEDIEGDSKGYFHAGEHRIAIQEGMSQSQTVKTAIHEVAHAKLHDRELNQDIEDAGRKDRRTKEVEAESIAYTVCQRFGIDTSDYSFGYIAGWSSGKDMKELKSSLDTIRKTASELITGIEDRLAELQRDRAMEQDLVEMAVEVDGMDMDRVIYYRVPAERESELYGKVVDLLREGVSEKEIAETLGIEYDRTWRDEDILLLATTERYEQYELLNVRNIERSTLVEAMENMTDHDRENIAAYLESKGAYTDVLATQETKEFGEYHIDYLYRTDTQELTDIKAKMEEQRKSLEPIAAGDVVIKFSGSMGSEWEISKITNMSPDEVGKLLNDMALLPDSGWDGDYTEYLKQHGAEMTLISSSAGLNEHAPQFFDFEYDADTGVRQGRMELVEDIRRVMPHIKDSDMEELAEQVLGKLQNMSDEEFAGVVLEPAEEIS